MENKRFIELNICGTLKLEMTAELERLYDKLCEEEKALDEGADNYQQYEKADERVYDAVMAEVRRRYPKLDITELVEYYEEEN